jgi:hypothetical protein
MPFCGFRLYSHATARDRQGVVLQEGNTVGYLTLIGSPLITNLKQLCDVTASRHVEILVTGDAFYRFDKSNTVSGDMAQTLWLESKTTRDCRISYGIMAHTLHLPDDTNQDHVCFHDAPKSVTFGMRSRNLCVSG